MKNERTEEPRRECLSGYDERSLMTRVGALELCVPQDRDGLFSTAVFERFQHSEKSLVVALAEMYIQGVSTRKVNAIPEVLPQATWLRRYVHFLRNTLDHVPRRRDDHFQQELRWLYDRRDLEEARSDLADWLTRWQAKYPKLTARVEGNMEETLAFYSLLRQHHRHLKSTNMLERFDQEIKRRTHIVLVFPKTQKCLHVARALAIETQENQLEANHPVSEHDPPAGAPPEAAADGRLTAAISGRTGVPSGTPVLPGPNLNRSAQIEYAENSGHYWFRSEAQPQHYPAARDVRRWVQGR